MKEVMEKGSSILEKILLAVTVVLMLTLVSCELGCQECYDVTRTVYYPEFSTYVETICYEISCDE